jgi:hypothetical protein
MQRKAATSDARTGNRGRVAQLARQASDNGWRLSMVEHDRAVTQAVPLRDGVQGRLLLSRTDGVRLEVHYGYGAAIVALDTVPTPTEVTW